MPAKTQLFIIFASLLIKYKKNLNFILTSGNVCSIILNCIIMDVNILLYGLFNIILGG